MSILGNIFSKIFGGNKAQAQPAPAAARPAAAPAQAQAAPRPAAPAVAPVDVEAILTQLAAAKGQPSNWRTSIVDLLKLLDIDNSLAARKELAQELGYKGELNGSAEMNTFLIRQVMSQLAKNGGKVPAELRD